MNHDEKREKKKEWKEKRSSEPLHCAFTSNHLKEHDISLPTPSWKLMFGH
jgi:hypothetical protein